MGNLQDPLSCLACIGQQAGCYASTCKDACDADLNASECISCVASADCTANMACSIGCSIDDLTKNIWSLQNLMETAGQTSQPLTNFLRSASPCYESQALMKTCGTQCYSSPNRAQCSATCLRGKGIGYRCASCLGNKIQCTVSRCLRFCSADANGRACRSCVRRSCGSCNSQKSFIDENETSYATTLAELAGSDSREMPIVP